MVEIKPMDEGFILIDCLHGGPIDSTLPAKRGDGWQDAPDLPPHPWSDETIAELAAKYKRISEGWAGDPAREFMREMIQRYGTCAILAWEDRTVVGFLRFYPLSIAQLIVRSGSAKEHPIAKDAMVFDPDDAALWVHCVMTCKPYETPEAAKEVGSRKGIGTQLVRALIPWAKDHGWKRILKGAHSDLDCFYGTYGGGGKAFWEKVGFKVVGTFRAERWGGDWTDIIERQRKAKGMTAEEVWTWFLMAYEL